MPQAAATANRSNLLLLSDLSLLSEMRQITIIGDNLHEAR